MLNEQLMQDLKAAMKAKDAIRKNTITMLRAAIKQVEVDERRTPSESEMFAIVQRQIRERNKAIADFEAGNRSDLVEQAQAEIKILEAYLPPQLSETELEQIIDEVIEAEGRSMGPVMKALSQRVAGNADMSLVNRLVREKLK